MNLFFADYMYLFIDLFITTIVAVLSKCWPSLNYFFGIVDSGFLFQWGALNLRTSLIEFNQLPNYFHLRPFYRCCPIYCWWSVYSLEPSITCVPGFGKRSLSLLIAPFTFATVSGTAQCIQIQTRSCHYRGKRLPYSSSPATSI